MVVSNKMAKVKSGWSYSTLTPSANAIDNLNESKSLSTIFDSNFDYE